MSIRVARRTRAGCPAALLLFSGSVQAHSFGRLYNLPVPFWMYIWGAAATLILSFLVVGWFAARRNIEVGPRSIDLGGRSWARPFLSVTAMAALKIFSLWGLFLCIATGLLGTRNPYLNFSMTFFWIVFGLGFTYFTALVGNLYAEINPWRSLVTALANLTGSGFRGRVAYPAALGCWPALALYAGFIAIELSGRSGPRGLALMLLGYGVLNLAGAWLLGCRDWFRHCEFFSVLFRLVSKMAPLQYRPPDGPGRRGRLSLQAPFAGLLRGRAASIGEVLFVLFFLSSTAFDGLRATLVWSELFWQDIAGLLRPWTGDNIVQAYPLLRALQLGCDVISLVLSPFLYLVLYLACLTALKRITRCPLSLRELALRFAYPLLPIALVYHLTHYYTLIITQGLMILRLLSDPFGEGWNLFGTALWLPKPIVPDMDWVWHTQVGLILLGHIASVYLSHLEALRLFPDRRTAALSQLPMLTLMVAFTSFGLWILAQPITAVAE